MSSLEERIKDVCRRHIWWLHHIRMKQDDLYTGTGTLRPWIDETRSNEHTSQAGCFAADYWVTGNVIMTQHNVPWQSQNRMTATAFQILKLSQFKEFIGDTTDAGYAMAKDLMNDIYVPWLVELDRLDGRKTCAWAHSNIEESIKFRLDDHFWIWKALVCLDDVVTKLRLPSRQQVWDSWQMPEEQRKWLHRLYSKNSGRDSESSMIENLDGPARTFMAVANRLSPRNVQVAVLQNFATENDFLGPGRTMLAVTRSAVRTRFLLHARDLALFYDESENFFVPGRSSMRLWETMIDAQLHHEENMNTDWHNALRYALTIVMGVRGHTLSRAYTASELVRKSVDVLISIGGSDAFFPGYLDEVTKEPMLFEDDKYRDKFYHANFEINYILLCNAQEISAIFSRVGVDKDFESTGAATASNPRLQAAQGDTLMITGNRGANIPFLSETNNNIAFLGNQPGSIKQSRFQLGNSVHASNVNYIDDEWLYPYPDFLRGRIVVEDLQTPAAPTTAEMSPESFVSLHQKAVEAGMSQCRDWIDEAESKESQLAVHIVDMGQGTQLLDRPHKTAWDAEDSSPRSRLKSLNSIRDLCAFLDQPRTPMTAGRRLVWLPHADFFAAIATCLFSPHRERTELRKLFERHASYAKYMMEETILPLNRWQTELCLSFYYLRSAKDSPAERWPGLPTQDEKPLSFPGLQKMEIRRGSMAFCFDGDLFNHFWTCHFVEHMPNAEFNGEYDHEFDIKCESSDDLCSQRRVIELRLVQRILQKMNDASNRFLDEVRAVLNIKHSSLALAWLDLLDTDVPRDLEQLKILEKYLKHVEDDLSDNLNLLLEKWNRRETWRGEEQPRWTQEDEKNHKVIIKRLSTEVQRAIGDLQAKRDDMCKLKEFLSETRENFRVKWERDRNEMDREKDQKDANIRNLTYVTLIFQPLGFAASFYSMSGTPDTALIVSLVECAAAAFFVTLVLIWGYRAFVTLYKGYTLKKASHKSNRRYVLPAWAVSLQLALKFVWRSIRKFARWILAILRLQWYRFYQRNTKINSSTEEETGNAV